jgi:hypothetical protein
MTATYSRFWRLMMSETLIDTAGFGLAQIKAEGCFVGTNISAHSEEFDKYFNKNFSQLKRSKLLRERLIKCWNEAILTSKGVIK